MSSNTKLVKKHITIKSNTKLVKKRAPGLNLKQKRFSIVYKEKTIYISHKYNPQFFTIYE